MQSRMLKLGLSHNALQVQSHFRHSALGCSGAANERSACGHQDYSLWGFTMKMSKLGYFFEFLLFPPLVLLVTLLAFRSSNPPKPPPPRPPRPPAPPPM